MAPAWSLDGKISNCYYSICDLSTFGTKFDQASHPPPPPPGAPPPPAGGQSSDMLTGAGLDGNNLLEIPLPPPPAFATAPTTGFKSAKNARALTVVSSSDLSLKFGSARAPAMKFGSAPETQEVSNRGMYVAMYNKI